MTNKEIVILKLKDEFRVAAVNDANTYVDATYVLDNFSVSANNTSQFIATRDNYTEAYFLACEYRNAIELLNIKYIDVYENYTFDEATANTQVWPDNPVEVGHA